MCLCGYRVLSLQRVIILGAEYIIYFKKDALKTAFYCIISGYEKALFSFQTQMHGHCLYVVVILKIVNKLLYLAAQVQWSSSKFS